MPLWASDVVLAHSDVAPVGRSDVTCSAYSRAKRTSHGEADTTHEVRITVRNDGRLFFAVRRLKNS